MEIKLKENENGYEVVEKIVLEKFRYFNESIIVYLRVKFKENDEWDESVELLLNQGCNYLMPTWFWETDWWEGQTFIDIVKASPISELSSKQVIEKGDFIFCPECRYALNKTVNYCPKCGQRVKFNV